LVGVDAFSNATLQNINRERDGVLFADAARGSDLDGVFVQIVLLFFDGAEIKDGTLFSRDGMGRNRRRFMINHHDRSSAGRQNSFGQAESKRRARAVVCLCGFGSSRTSRPRSEKFYRDAIGRPAERFMRSRTGTDDREGWILPTRNGR